MNAEDISSTLKWIRDHKTESIIAGSLFLLTCITCCIVACCYCRKKSDEEDWNRGGLQGSMMLAHTDDNLNIPGGAIPMADDSVGDLLHHHTGVNN